MAGLATCSTAGELLRSAKICRSSSTEELASDGLTTEDMLAVCRSGVVLMPSEKDIKTGDWKYRIEGYTADQEDVALVFTLKPERKAVFITAFKRSHG
jgi:hypothetical protein